MWVVSSDSSLINLDRYDDVLVMAPPEKDGLPDLGASHKVMARKILSDGRMVAQVLFEGSRGECFQAGSALAGGMKRGVRLMDFQLHAGQVEKNGQKPIVAQDGEPETPAIDEPDGGRRGD